jgi:uncharacterized membrane-anchored protein YhcB (DUF1043 family)
MIEELWFNSIMYMFTGLIVGYLLGRVHERNWQEAQEEIVEEKQNDTETR